MPESFNYITSLSFPGSLNFITKYSICQNNKFLTLTYNPDQQRIKTVFTDGVVTKTKYFSTDYEEEVTAVGTRKLHYISSPYGLAAIYIDDGVNPQMYYVLKDHLGSITGLVDQNGNLAEEYSYDAWGRRRNPATGAYLATATNLNYLIDRGYTGHEHLDEFGLINMNGRMYDPVLGRMLSPDNYVQDATSTQTFNRYSYAGNNPLVYTDPSVEFLVESIIMGVVFNVMMNGPNINNLGDAIGYAVVGGLAGGVGAATGGLVAGAIGFGGFAGGAVVGASSGFAGGFIGGSGNAWVEGANFGQGIVSGLKAGGIVSVTGGLIGGTVAGIDAVRNGANFWNGSVNEVGGAGSGMFLDEEIPAGHKPTPTGEIAETSSNPNYEKYGMTRNGGTKAHYGVDYVGKEGDDVFAMYDGTVIKIGGSKAYGENFVRTSSTINGKTYNVDYGHMSKHFVTINKDVTAGQTIGQMGRLGNIAGTSYPTHVHIAVWQPVNGLQGFVMPWWK
jgi:RHS repeat-associated protein